MCYSQSALKVFSAFSRPQTTWLFTTANMNYDTRNKNVILKYSRNTANTQDCGSGFLSGTRSLSLLLKSWVPTLTPGFPRLSKNYISRAAQKVQAYEKADTFFFVSLCSPHAFQIAGSAVRLFIITSIFHFSVFAVCLTTDKVMYIIDTLSALTLNHCHFR